MLANIMNLAWRRVGFTCFFNSSCDS